MPDSLRHPGAVFPLSDAVGQESGRSSWVTLVLAGVVLAHLGLLWQAFNVPGYFDLLDWWLSALMLLVLLGLTLTQVLGRMKERQFLAWLALSNMVFLAIKVIYALFWVGTSERLMTDLATLLPWTLTFPMLLATSHRPAVRNAGLFFPLACAALAAFYLFAGGAQVVDARVWSGFLQLGVAGGMVLLGARFVQNLNRRAECFQSENQSLSRLAFFDDLTGLHNRTYLDQRLQELCQTGEPMAVLFADLDGFKSINDTLGHAVGDDVLRLLSSRLKEMGHATACLSRVSGDEFVVVLAGRTRAEVTTFAEWMVRELSRPVLLQEQEMRLSVSIGISLFAEDATRTHDLLLNADRAMYAVKRTGKNGFRFYGDHVLGIEEPRQRIEQELRHARDRGELFLMFQPICDLKDGEPHSIEVLLRWNNPTLGRVGPDVFIPIAEENGMIAGIGEWVLSSALAAAQVWQAEGFDNLRVAVNVSPAQLMQSGFAQMVEDTLELYDLPANILELEVTEGVDLHERSQVMHALQQLRELGVVLSLDDFGTGFASLSRLNELPVQVVKIDKVFVSDLDGGEEKEERTRYVRTLISAMVGVASSLELALVVEGVETDQQREQLLALGCRRAQGYFFAKPMSEDELRGRLWLQNWSIPDAKSSH